MRTALILGVGLLLSAALPAQYYRHHAPSCGVPRYGGFGGGYFGGSYHGGGFAPYSYTGPALHYGSGVGFSRKATQWAATPSNLRGSLLFAQRAFAPNPEPAPRRWAPPLTRPGGKSVSVGTAASRVPGAVWVPGIRTPRR